MSLLCNMINRPSPFDEKEMDHVKQPAVGVPPPLQPLLSTLTSKKVNIERKLKLTSSSLGLGHYTTRIDPVDDDADGDSDTGTEYNEDDDVDNADVPDVTFT